MSCWALPSVSGNGVRDGMGACSPRQPRRQDDGELFRPNCGPPRMGSAFRRVRGVNRLTADS